MSNGYYSASEMESSLLASTYTNVLSLQHNEISFQGAICFTHNSLELLKGIHADFLHPQELSYFKELLYLKRQYSYLIGRYCAKQALVTYAPQHPLAASYIKAGVFDQPVLYSPYHPNIQVSISHTNSMGAALVFPEAHPMAIDIETVSLETLSVLQTQMTPTETVLASTIFKDASFGLTMLWTIKEALSKVLKCGLTLPFELLQVSKIAQQGENYLSYFTYFVQYEALSFFLGKTVCSLVYPKRTEFYIDLPTIQKIINEKEL